MVSAIITTCKRPAHILQRAIMSVLNQTYREMELIIVDDSPSDFKERDAVKKMIEDINKSSDIDIYYIRHDKCSGACVARNTGIELSHGELIGFLDDDDEWMPNKVEIMMPCFDDEKVALVYSNWTIVNDDTHEQSCFITENHTGSVYEYLILSNFISSTSFPLLRRSAVVEAGMFDPLMKSSQDYDLWLRISVLYKVKYINSELTKYHVHSMEQISKSIDKKIAGFERINFKNSDYLDTHNKAFWARYMYLVPMYAAKGNLSIARKVWGKCVIKCPLLIRKNIFYFMWASGISNTRVFYWFKKKRKK